MKLGKSIIGNLGKGKTEKIKDAFLWWLFDEDWRWWKQMMIIKDKMNYSANYMLFTFPVILIIIIMLLIIKKTWSAKKKSKKCYFQCIIIFGCCCCCCFFDNQTIQTNPDSQITNEQK